MPIVESITGRIAQLAGLARSTGMRGQLARGGVGSVSVKIASLGLGFVLAVVLARALGAEGFGIYSYVFALLSILAIPARFGLPNLVVREVARARVESDWEKLRGVIRWSNGMAAGFSLALTLIAGAAALVFASRFTRIELDTFGWGLALVPLLVLGDLRGAALRGLHYVVSGLLPEHILRPAFFILFCGLFLVVSEGGLLGPDDAMRLHALGAALAFTIGALLYLRVRPEPVKIAAPRYQSREWMASAWPLALAAGMQVVIRHTDIIMLGFFNSAGDVGVYRAVAQSSTLIGIGLMAINQVVAPQFSGIYARGDIETLQRLVTVSSRLILVLAAPIAVIMIVFGDRILGLLFGASFSEGHLPLGLLAIGQLVNAAFGSVAVLLNMTGHESKTARGVAIAAALNLLLNFVLIPPFGTAGAATATTITMTLWNVILWFEVRHHLDIDSAAFPVRRNRPLRS